MKNRDGARLEKSYRALDRQLDLPVAGEEAIRPDLIITFPFDHASSGAEVSISTDEFVAVCPWTGLPDQGTLTVMYTPRARLLELKSLKYYLLSFRSVGIVQEHAAVRVLDDLVRAARPRQMTVTLDYHVRGGIHTTVTVAHPRRSPGRPDKR